METIQAEVVANGKPRLPSVEVVSKALSHASSNSTFLKNAGIASPSRCRLSSEASLHEELDAERQRSSVLHQQVEELQGTMLIYRGRVMHYRGRLKQHIKR
ncbi:hypothetical protein C2845_PMPSC055845 [Panicum miliaceum]|uniref:Uncharacterized protein n=1 Tax=Panicum miliaceum TaxID=4540 RepID=A0A3L6PBL8_PANMI|nr:hypothetical protein C2845_PMPSC055845 [Panicum miliaceum]